MTAKVLLIGLLAASICDTSLYYVEARMLFGHVRTY